MKKLLYASLLGLTLNACGSKIDDLSSGRPASNVAVTETDGVVTATIQADATTPQILVGSANSNAADASVTFPPNSLAVSTEISIGEAVDSSAAITAELGITGLIQAGNPVYIGPSASGTTVTVTAPLTIQLPIPVEKLDGAGLTATESKLILLYTIFQNNAWVSGSIPVEASNIVGALIRLSFSGLGYFQIVYLATPGTQKEVTTSVRPLLGRNETTTPDDGDKETETNEGTGALSEYRGYYSGTVTELSNEAIAGGSGNGKYCAISSDNFKMWLSPYDILVFKVSRPMAGNNSADFDGNIPSFNDISNRQPASFDAEVTAYPNAAAITDYGVYQTSGVKYAVADYQAAKSFQLVLTGGFKGTTTKTYEGKLGALIGNVKVCEYNLVLTKQ